MIKQHHIRLSRITNKQATVVDTLYTYV